MPVEENLEEGWLRIGEPSGDQVTIGGDPGPFHSDYDFVDFMVTVEGEGLHARALVRTQEDASPRSLTAFFRELADDWRGERGEPSWEAIEHGLRIAVRRDALGHLFMTFELRPSYRKDSWAARVVVKVEPGEEMSQVARAVQRLLSHTPEQ